MKVPVCSKCCPAVDRRSFTNKLLPGRDFVGIPRECLICDDPTGYDLEVPDGYLFVFNEVPA